VLRDGREYEVPVTEVRVDEVVVVRVRGAHPVDGRVIEGEAPVTEGHHALGESVPVDKAPVMRVCRHRGTGGFLKVRATKVGSDTTFARIVRLVEETEAHKAPVQRFADRFSAYYLPTVLLLALATYVLSGSVVNAVAVLVVSGVRALSSWRPLWSSWLASGNAARRGLSSRAGSGLEASSRGSIPSVMDKTGTLTSHAPGHLT